MRDWGFLLDTDPLKRNNCIRRSLNGVLEML